MRMKLLKVVVVLLLAGSGDSRPQKTEEPTQPEPKSEGWKAIQATIVSPDAREDSSSQPKEPQRHLKDLHYIDQSLRTVATQLLNVTGAEDAGKPVNKDAGKAGQKQPEKIDASLVKKVNTEISNLESMGIGFGRPINSKFGYFESSHPGQAMAMTEEELEREMSSTRLITAYKNHPTTTGGISTWILLNPPSTTVKTLESDKKQLETESRTTTLPGSTMERVETTERVMEKLTSPVLTTLRVEEPSTKKPVATTRRTTTDGKLEKATQKAQAAEKPEVTQVTTKLPQSTVSILENRESAPVSTTKKMQPVRTTAKPKLTTTKTTVVSKSTTTKTSRPNQQARPKPSTRRTTTVKPETKNETSTAKIEKVTFKPIQLITTPKTKPETTDKPVFVTKIKASVLMDTQKATTVPASTAGLTSGTTPASTLPGSDLVEVPAKPKPAPTKVNNVLKVQLKKPLVEPTKIEIEPIKVNAPVLKIEKVDKEKKPDLDDKDVLNGSAIDLKFDFNPELTKINVETSTEVSSTTTKRPRHNSKRKKNKVRRRKPSTTSTSTVATTTSTTTTTTEALPATELTESEDIQESKIAPETKVANSTKTKKKPPQKAISTQIYNFLSREVMPSFGVMSLVGLGLGLASYFLYPFGGAISRRNYEVEPKYKYNLEEYGGNYGQSEEEVLSKVLQGMTTNDKYGTKKYDNNYYQYQHYDGAYEAQTTRKPESRYPSSSPMYRPENTGALKYRNTDYRYAEVQSTPNYYDRAKQPEYAGQETSGSANRQFVVGSVPKEYAPFDDKNPATSGKIVSYEPTESGQFDAGQSYNLPLVNPSYRPEPQTPRSDEGYEEIEITPTAVAVEHGPRSLKRRSLVASPLDGFRDVGSRKIHPRFRRESVIQVIPSKKELEEEEKEENLSNEILDIIDSALPGGDDQPKDRREDNEVEDLEAQRRKQKEEEKTRLKEITMKTTERELETSSAEPTVADVSTGSSTLETDASTASTGKTTEENTVDWIELTTSKPKEESSFNIFNFVKKVAEIKFKLGLTLLKHASEGFARYLGHVQKRINGDE